PYHRCRGRSGGGRGCRRRTRGRLSRRRRCHRALPNSPVPAQVCPIARTRVTLISWLGGGRYHPTRHETTPPSTTTFPANRGAPGAVAPCCLGGQRREPS